MFGATRMTDARSMAHAEAEPAAAGEVDSAAVPETLHAAGDQWASASQDVLFEPDETTPCDACGSAIPEVGEDRGYRLPGQGLYMWVRGESVRFDEAPLCASCASAIGMTALARWEIEEEEG
jgi:hypothetical protein